MTVSPWASLERRHPRPRVVAAARKRPALPADAGTGAARRRAQEALPRLGFGRSVASEKEAPNMFVIMV
jgi:hypothetical protein